MKPEIHLAQYIIKFEKGVKLQVCQEQGIPVIGYQVAAQLVEFMSQAFQHQIGEVFTSIPAIVVNIRDINQQRVDVKIAVNNITPEGEYKENPVILSVPLMFPSTKTSALTFEVNVGDPVLLSFSQRCIDAFKSSGGIVNPLDLRRFDKRDAVAILGLSSFNDAPNNPAKHTWPHNTSDTVLTHNLGSGVEVELRLTKDGKLKINSNVEVEVNSPTSTVNGNAVVNGNAQFNGNLSCTGAITANSVTAPTITSNGKVLATHTHPYTDDGTPMSTGSPN